MDLKLAAPLKEKPPKKEAPPPQGAAVAGEPKLSKDIWTRDRMQNNLVLKD